MKCGIPGCKKLSKHIYNIGDVKFYYCDKHENIPKKIKEKFNKTYFRPMLDL